jgi:hypothetical protein
MLKKVAVVLVNYHDYAERFLSACRDSLRTQTYPRDSFKVYIIDNDSSSETIKYLQDNYPEAVILPRANGNYCAANNLGFKEAIKDGAQYLVTVNMDTVMDKNWLAELVAALDNNPSAGIAQSKILLYPKTEIEKNNPKINSLGNVIQFLGFGFTDSYGEPDREIAGYPEILGYASGCSFIVRREVFAHIGGWNEEYYMYHDDLEFSLKAKLSGYKVILAPQSIIFHRYEFSRSVKMFYYMERNRYLTLLTFASQKYLALIFLPAFFMDLGMFFFAFFSGRSKEELKIYAYFVKAKNSYKIRAEREFIKEISVVPFAKIATGFRGKIEFQEIANPILSYLVNPLLNVYFKLIKRLI